jgi:methyl-accepting chemotaxis protein
MALIVGLAAGQSVFRSVSVYRSSVDAIDASLAFALMMRVVEKMSLERGPALISLASDAKSGAGVRQLLQASRDATLKAIAELQLSLSKLRRSNITQVSGRDQSNINVVHDLAALHLAINQKVDDQLALPLTGRRQNVNQEYVDDTVQLQNASLPLLNNLQARINSASPDAAAIVQIARYAADLRDVGGLVPSVVAAAIGEKRPLTHQEASAVLKVLGGVVELHSQINAALAYVGNPPPMMTAWDKAKSDYFSDGQTLIAKILAAGETDGHYSLTLDEFLRDSRRALQSLMPIRDAGVAVALQRVAASRDAAWYELEIAIITFAGAVMALVGLWAFFRWRVVIPMIDLAKNVDRLTNNRSQIKISTTERQDEIGGLARAMEAYHLAIVDRDAYKQRMIDQEEKSRREIDRQKAIALEAIAGAVELNTQNAVKMISGAAQQVKAAARNAANLTDEVSVHSQAVAAASVQAAAASTTVSAAAEELTISIGNITESVARASMLANNTRAQCEQAQAIMQSLAGATTAVSKVSDLIKAVAKRTKMPALNATIESARAGIASKGFAVVAAQVKALAGQTGQATDNINRKIREIQLASDSAVAIMAAIKGNVSEVDDIARLVAVGMEEQNVKTESIASNVALTMQATQEIATQIGELNAEVNEARANAGAVSGAISNVTGKIEQLHQQLAEVLRTTLDDFRTVDNV